MNLFTFTKDIARRFPSMLAVLIALTLVVGLVESVSIVTLAPVVDMLVHPDLQGASALTKHLTAIMGRVGLPVSLFSALTVFIVIAVFKGILVVLAGFAIMTAREKVVRGLVSDTFREFFHARWYFFASQKAGTILNTFVTEMRRVGLAVQSMARLAAATVNLLFFVTVPLLISWQVALLSFAAGAAIASPFLLLGRFTYRFGRQTTDASNQFNSAIHESVGAAKLVLGCGNEKKMEKVLVSAFDSLRKAVIRYQTVAQGVPAMYQPLGLVVAAIGLVLARRYSVPLAETAVLLFALAKMATPLGQLINERNAARNMLPSYEQIQRLTASAREWRQPSGTKKFTRLAREIVLEDVTFSYPGHDATLIDVTVRIPRAGMVAFVGDSGAGKSTLIDVLMGFYQPDEGSLIVDGTRIEELDITSYRARIGYVPQDSTLFNNTIRENLLWANDSASDEEIREACRQAHAHGFIEQLPKGYETVVGDRGVRLSGGQIQRVALARAILRKPELLFLDEATSALDSESERLIQSAVEEMAGETTIIVVAHRLSTIMNADRIYVLDKGRIIEQGTYAQLVSLNGRFAHMVRLQDLKAAV